MEDILIGSTDRTIPVFIPDPASTTGAGKTGLAAAAITVTYTRYETDNDVVHNDVTGSLNDLSALTDAHNDWGWKEVSSTLSKGQYRLDIADAVFASGAWYAVVQVTITSGTAAATPKQFRLVSRNDLDGVRLGLTALPNAAAEAAGGLYTRGSGAGQIAQDANGRINANVAAIETADPTDTIRDAVVDDATRIDASALNTATGTTIPTNLNATVSSRATQTSVDDVPTNAELATALTTALTTAVSDSVPAIGSRPSVAQAAYMMVQWLTERDVTSTTMAVKKPDGSTTLFAMTLDDDTNPTNYTRST